MAAPDVGAVPGDVEVPSAGAGDGGSDGGNAGDPTLAAMEEIMRGEETLDAESGFELSKPPEPGTKRADDGDGKPPAGDPKASDKAATDAKSPGDAAAKLPESAADAPPELAPPALDVAAETRRLRKENLRLISDRQNLVQKTNEANQTIERARAFEADALAYRGLGDVVKADPIAFVLKYAGLGEGEEGLQKLLDKVIETEKSPTERRLEALERERKEERAANEKAEGDRRDKDVIEKNNRVIEQWKADTANFAKNDPDTYDVICSLDMGQAVVEACLEYHRIHNVLPAADVAATFVEKKLRAGLKNSKYAKSLNAASTPAAGNASGKPPAAGNAARPSNGTPAPKHSGTNTLTGVDSGTSAPRAPEYPEDDDARFRAVMDEMRANSEV